MFKGTETPGTLSLPDSIPVTIVAMALCTYLEPSLVCSSSAIAEENPETVSLGLLAWDEVAASATGSSRLGLQDSVLGESDMVV